MEMHFALVLSIVTLFVYLASAYSIVIAALTSKPFPWSFLKKAFMIAAVCLTIIILNLFIRTGFDLLSYIIFTAPAWLQYSLALLKSQPVKI